MLAYYLAITLDMKMTGVAAASAVQFVLRFLFNYTLVKCDKELTKGLIPLKDPISWIGLSEIAEVGKNSLYLYVMGWWAFDVFTQLASFLTESDLAA